MGNILKHLKPYVGAIFLSFVLLFIQAVCDLALPDYMSNIVNIGIQQNGVENAVIEVIRESEFDKLTLFIDEEDRNIIYDNYILLEKDSLSKEEYEDYLEEYPALENENLYKLDTKDDEVLAELNNIFSKPMMIVSGLNKAKVEELPGMEEMMQQMMMQQVEGQPQIDITKMDIFEILAMMPEEALNSMKADMDKQFAEIPDTMTTQGATMYVKEEYEAVGIDMDKLQNRYVLLEGAIMLGISLLSMIATVIVGYIGARIAASLGKGLRKDVFTKVVGFSNTEFDKFSTASLITRSTNDIQQIQMFIVLLIRVVFYAPILAIGGFLKVLGTNSGMGWVLAVSVVSVLSLVIILFGIAIPKFKSIQKLIDRLNLVTRESLTGMLVIRAFSKQKQEEEKFKVANTDLTKTNLFVNRIMVIMMTAMMFIMNGTTLLIVWIGAHKINEGIIQVGDMMAFMQYSMQIIMSFLMISMISIVLPRASVSAQRITEVLNTDVMIHDPKKAEKFNENGKGVVEFKNVSFKYPGAEENVLENINFTATPGKTTAFIGSTGSGKSTLINLIPRFYDITEGEILVDGVDIRNVTQHDLRGKIGYVPQKGILFSGTIESNLKYSDENMNDEVMSKAAEIAQAMEFISGTEDSFNTSIAQGGTNVSGGQKQRLSIARALAKNPDIYIFDDSFSALDYKTDAKLREALKPETENATVLIVAQRISTIRNAEQIIVLDEGKVVGIGTHKELLENCQVYNQIALSQLSKEELENE